MSREKKKRTAASFLGRKYGKNAFKTGSKKDGTLPEKPRSNSKAKRPNAAKKARPKSVYQKYLEANPKLKAQQNAAAQRTNTPKPEAKTEQPVKEVRLSPLEQAIAAIEQDTRLQGIQQRIGRGEEISGEDARYLEQQMALHQKLMDQLAPELESDLFDQFEKGSFF